MKFVVLRDTSGRWLWELRSTDGERVCVSAMGFKDQTQAFKSIQAVRAKAPSALVFDLVGTLLEGV